MQNNNLLSTYDLFPQLNHSQETAKSMYIPSNSSYPFTATETSVPYPEKDLLFSSYPSLYDNLEYTLSPPLSIESDISNTTFAQQQQDSAFMYYTTAMNLDIIAPSFETYVQQIPFQPLPANFESNITVEQEKKTECGHGLSDSFSDSSSSSIVSSPLSDHSSLTTEEAHLSGSRHKHHFHCDYSGCTKTFTRTYNLKSHRRTHTDEKPFMCDTCPKTFARQHDRNRHAKLHLGLKPFPCVFCDKSFARQDALNRHLKRDKRSSSLRALKENSSKYEIAIYPPPCLLLRQRQRRLAKKQQQQQQQQIKK